MVVDDYWWWMVMALAGDEWLLMVTRLTCNLVEFTSRSPDWLVERPIWQGLCWLRDGRAEVTAVIFHLFWLDFLLHRFAGCYTELLRSKKSQDTPNNTSYSSVGWWAASYLHPILAPPDLLLKLWALVLSKSDWLQPQPGWEAEPRLKIHHLQK